MPLPIYCNTCAKKIGYASKATKDTTYTCNICALDIAKVVSIEKLTESHYEVNGFDAQIVRSNSAVVLVEVEGEMFSVPHPDPHHSLSPEQGREIIINTARLYMMDRCDDMNYIYKTNLNDTFEPWVSLVLDQPTTLTKLLEAFHSQKPSPLKNWEGMINDRVFVRHMIGKSPETITIIGVS